MKDTRFNVLADVAVGVRDGTIDLEKEVSKIILTKTMIDLDKELSKRAEKRSAGSRSKIDESDVDLMLECSTSAGPWKQRRFQSPEKAAEASRKKHRLRDIEGEEENNREERNEKEKKKKRVIDGPDPPPEMPRNMRDHIDAEFGAHGVELILQKKLFDCDTRKDQNRLTIPKHKLESTDFLTSEEKKEAKRRENGEPNSKILGLRIRLVDPKLELTFVDFKKWKLENSSSYVLTSAWHKIVTSKDLAKGHVIQVWFFRDRTGEPCFAIVRLNKGS